ncbi:DegV family protein [Spiroplasma endosymbiont of Aspidapion aeneum]|uniref:DegV family protein n=1 Tax=Spiroplasma endosymbiont of Aspidapion aeneum TaxID=3066276 RepID=UPI00313CA990
MKIAILIDSSAYIEEEYINNTNIFLIPLKVVNGQITFNDTRINFIEQNLQNIICNKNSNIKTSMVPPGELEEIYDNILKKYDRIYHFPIAVNLSSMYASSVQLAKEDKYKDKIFVFGHYVTAAQLGDFAKYINVKCQENPALSPDEVQRELDNWAEQSWTYFIPSDIARLSKSGRTKTLLITLLKILRTRVCIEWAENPIKFAFSPKLSQIAEKICKHILSTYTKNQFTIKFHRAFYIENDSKEIRLMLKVFETHGFNIEVIDCPSVYLIHAGGESIGISIINDELKKVYQK